MVRMGGLKTEVVFNRKSDFQQASLLGQVFLTKRVVKPRGGREAVTGAWPRGLGRWSQETQVKPRGWNVNICGSLV